MVFYTVLRKNHRDRHVILAAVCPLAVHSSCKVRNIQLASLGVELLWQ